jgi:hypothetical protein
MKGHEIVRFLISLAKSTDIKKYSDFSNFALWVLSDGMASEEDYKLLYHSGVIDWIMIFCASSHCDPQDKNLALRFFLKMSNDTKSILRTCEQNALISFLTQESLECQVNFILSVCSLLHQITFNLLKIFDDSPQLLNSLFVGQLIHLCAVLVMVSEDNRDALAFDYSIFAKLVCRIVENLETDSNFVVFLTNDEKTALKDLSNTYVSSE